MKMIVLFLTVALMHTYAGTRAQQVSLSLKDVPIEMVFKMIERQTSYVFFYRSEILKAGKKVTIEVKNVDVKKVLDESLKELELRYLIDGKIIMVEKVEGNKELVYLRSSPLLDITGKIMNEKGEPLAGATVRVKGKDKATSTDASGSFLLKNVDEGDVLIVSSIGYKTLELALKEVTMPVKIRLQVQTADLEEVKVEYSTGYQKIPKERAPGSFVFIDSAMINRSPDANIFNRLDGIAPGILFDRRNPDPKQMRIQIRGLYSLNLTTAKPLIVVNNFPYDDDINNINPSDIENITILRDAAAASIWGAKSGNGVIVITTKDGQFNKAAQITLSSNLSVTPKPDLFSLPIIPVSEYVDLEKSLFERGIFDNDINDTYSYPPLTEGVQILSDLRNKVISQQEADRRLNELKGRDVRNDFLKYIYRPAINHRYSLGVAGGSNNIKYYLSVGYDKAIEQLVGNDNDRVTVNLNNTIKISRKLEVSVMAGYAQTGGHLNSLGGYGNTNYNMGEVGDRSLPLYAQLADVNGNTLTIDKRFRSAFLDTLGGGQLLDWRFKPLDELKFSDNSSKGSSLNTNLGINYKILPGLDLDLKYQYQTSRTTNKNYKSIETFYARNIINIFTNLNSDDPVTRYPIPLGGILNSVQTQLQSQNIRGSVSFSNNRGEHRISAIIGGDIRETKTNESRTYLYGYDKNTLNFSSVDFLHQYPLFYYEYSTYINNLDGYTASTDRFVSIFTNVAYTFGNKYTISASARNDASNLFGVKTNDKWKPLWSIGVKWDISKEAFYGINVLPQLSIRATYGFQGNTNNATSGLMTLSFVPPSYNTLNNLSYASINRYPNSSLRWEKVRTTNIALDFGVKNSRLTGSIDFYTKKSTDVISSMALPLSAGRGSISANSAHMKGSGFDLQLNSRNINNPHFGWITNVSLSYSKYIISKYLGNTQSLGFYASGEQGIISTSVEGYSPDLFVSYRWAGLDPQTGDPVGYVDGKMSKDYATILFLTPFSEQKKYGSAAPLYFGNILNSFSWKGISFSTNITYKWKYYFFKPVFSSGQFIGGGIPHKDYLNRWKTPGDESMTSIPSASVPFDYYRDQFYRYSEVNVQKGDHLRLNDLRLNYSFNKKNISLLPFQRIDLSLNWNNLNILLWKASDANLDPENLEGMRLPKTLTVGLDIVF